MIIANPIYDVVFKKLMENERVAKFFIGTMLGEHIESLEMQPQEFTYRDNVIGLTVFRLDFIAVIKTKEGTFKKILIEIQKAKKAIDVMRFRNYLAEQYKKQEIIDDEKIALPITTIYILGFTLQNIKTACVHVERQYRDLINETIITAKSNFIEGLTHDSYIVQVKRLTGRYQTKLEKLLSVFEQRNFVEDTKTIKDYPYELEDEEIKRMTNILHSTGIDPASRKKIEIEQEAWRTIEAMFAPREKKFLKELKEVSKKLKENEKVLTEKNKALIEKDKALKENEKALKENEKALKENEKALTEKDKALEAQRKLIEKLKKKLDK